MKHQHGTKTLFVASLFLLTLLVFGACKRDKCKKVVCVNGDCIDGICNCDLGYFGDDCNTVINEDFAGSWSGEEECLAGSDEYAMAIALQPGSKTGLEVVGFWGIFDDTLSMEFAANGTDVLIAHQRLHNVEVEGEGTTNFDRDKLDITYRVYGLGQSQSFDQCTLTITKN